MLSMKVDEFGAEERARALGPRPCAAAAARGGRRAGRQSTGLRRWWIQAGGKFAMTFSEPVP